MEYINLLISSDVTGTVPFLNLNYGNRHILITCRKKLCHANHFTAGCSVLNITKEMCYFEKDSCSDSRTIFK